MTLKDLFAKSNQPLTFEQFEALAKENNAKFVDLSEGGYTSKQKYDDDLKGRDTRISELSATIAQRDTDLADLNKKLADAGHDKAAIEKLNGDFAALQQKYADDTAAYQQKLKDQEYGHLVSEFANEKKFTSKAAKRDFVAALTAKKLAVEDGKIIGASDFVDAYAQENEDAFEKEPDPNQPPKPNIAAPTGNGGGGGEPNPISFNFNHIS